MELLVICLRNAIMTNVKSTSVGQKDVGSYLRTRTAWDSNALGLLSVVHLCYLYLVNLRHDTINIGMLVLSRKIGERIWIGNDISVTVVRVSGGGVRLGIEAPENLPVVREELKESFERAGALEKGTERTNFPGLNRT